MFRRNYQKKKSCSSIKSYSKEQFLVNIFINDLLSLTDNIEGAFSLTLADDLAILTVREKSSK